MNDIYSECFENLKNAIESFCANLMSAFAPLCDAVAEIIKIYGFAFGTAFDSIILQAASPKVRHLALHGKKRRTRKKNLARARKEFRKVVNKNG